MDEKINLNSLSDHIDEPIKKVVVGLSLLGFKTAMSCCGFDYKGEKVKKGHIYDKPYIYIDHKHLTSYLKGLLIDLSWESGWSITYLNPQTRFVDFCYHSWESVGKGNGWDKTGCPHRHESSVLAISMLEQVIENKKNFFEDRVIITDGNKIYKDEFKLKYWQYEPTESWIVTPETFNSL